MEKEEEIEGEKDELREHFQAEFPAFLFISRWQTLIYCLRIGMWQVKVEPFTDFAGFVSKKCRPKENNNFPGKVSLIQY